MARTSSPAIPKALVTDSRVQADRRTTYQRKRTWIFMLGREGLKFLSQLLHFFILKLILLAKLSGSHSGGRALGYTADFQASLDYTNPVSKKKLTLLCQQAIAF